VAELDSGGGIGNDTNDNNGGNGTAPDTNQPSHDAGEPVCDCNGLADHPFRDINDYEFNHREFERDPVGFINERLRECGCGNGNDTRGATGDHGDRNEDRTSPGSELQGDGLAPPPESPSPLVRAPGVFDRGAGGRSSEAHLNLEGTQYIDLYFFAISWGFDVTSTTGGAHNPGSVHSLGRAVDVRTRDRTDAQVDAFIDAARSSGIRVRDERTRPAGQRVWSGPHVHLSLPERAVTRSRESMPSLLRNQQGAFHLLEPGRDLLTDPEFLR
jgi:hypothetical protein